jgi:hypothetical protein
MSLEQLRHDIEHRLAILGDEAGRLDAALEALIPRDTPATRPQTPSSPPANASNQRKAARAPGSSRARGTKRARRRPRVLDRLADGQAKTARENAPAETALTPADRALAALRGDLDAGLRNT